MRRVRSDTHLPPGAVQVGEQQFDDVALVNAERGPTVGGGDAAVGPDHDQSWQTWERQKTNADVKSAWKIAC